jgi:hypothetical protein
VLRPLSALCLALALLSLLESLVWLGALAAELGAHLFAITVVVLAVALAVRDLVAAGSAFVACVLFAGPLAPLYRAVKPTPQYGPLVRVAQVHVDAQPVSPTLLSAWLGSGRADAAALTGVRPEDARALGPTLAGFRVHTRFGPAGTAQLLMVRDSMQAHLKSPDANLLSSLVKVGRCNVRAVVVDLPSRLSVRHLTERQREIAALASTHAMARSVWLGHFGSRAEASDLAKLEHDMELRDSRHGEGRLPTAPASLGALGLPVDHILVHGWLGVRARSVDDQGLSALTHRAVRATLELTEPRCRTESVR